MNLYGFVGNDGVGSLDALGLKQLEVDDSGLPDPAQVPVRYVHSGGSWTRFPERSFRCDECSCLGGGNYTFKKCYVSARATIEIDLSQAKELGQPRWKIHGHEQRHVVDRLQWIKQFVTIPVSNTSAPNSSTKEICERHRKNFETKFSRMLDRALSPQWMASHDTNPSTPRPAEGEGYDPLPGTPYPPNRW